jgi:hypothetical protein
MKILGEIWEGQACVGNVDRKKKEQSKPVGDQWSAVGHGPQFD